MHAAMAVVWIVNLALGAIAVWQILRSRKLDREIAYERERVERLETELARRSDGA